MTTAKLLSALLAILVCLASTHALAQDGSTAAQVVEEPQPAEAGDTTGGTESAAEQLINRFGYTADALEVFDDVNVALEHARTQSKEASQTVTEIQATQARMEERARLLVEFAAEPGEPAVKTGRIARLADARTYLAIAASNVEAHRELASGFDTEAKLLEEVASGIVKQSADEIAQRELEKTLADNEEEARRAAEEARRREEATKDATLRQLFARERELREELVELAAATREDSELSQKAKEFSDQFKATKGELLGQVDALSAEPLPAERVEKVDPLVSDVLRERRRLWAILSQARSALADADEEVSKLNEEVAEAKERVSAEKSRESELGGGELWKQRVKVAETQLEVAQVKLNSAKERQERANSQVELLSDGVEFYSTQLREVIDRASPHGRNLVYGVLSPDSWSDAMSRLNDRVQHARSILEAREEAETSLADRWLEYALWAGGLLIRLILVAMFLALGLRAVPALTRRILDFMQSTKIFRRRPSSAVKIFEVLRAVARPIVTYIGVTYVVTYVVKSVNELVFVQWAVDAFFTYKVGTRIAATVALPRWYREREGMVSTGKEDDLKSDEAAIADVLRLDLDRGTKFVRSARIVLFVATIWYYAPDIAIAIVGVSVLSGLITTLTKVAIVVVIFWMLSAWKDEFSNLFKRLAGDRIPKATAFVDRNKDRPWGVVVIGVVSVVVIIWELLNFIRRAILDTEWFKRASAYAFKTKIELQQRDEPTEAEIRAFLPDDLEAAFSPDTELDAKWFVERESLTKMKEEFAPLLERGSGAMVVVGEPGAGTSTTCEWLLGEREHVRIEVPDRTFDVATLIDILTEAMEIEATTAEELVSQLLERDSTVFYLDGLELLYLRDIGGYGAYRQLMDIIHRCGRRHIFVVAANRFAWDFLTRVYDNRHVFHVISRLPRWTDEELRVLVEQRMDGLPYSTSFSELADLDGKDSAEVVKTARGYFRYLAEFTRGLPGSAMHYWLRSLSGGSHNTYSVGLFTRPGSSTLTAAPPAYRFVLAAITQHGSLTAAQASQVDNTPAGTCELAVDYFMEAGVITCDADTVYRLACPMTPVTLRHLEDSNLL